MIIDIPDLPGYSIDKDGVVYGLRGLPLTPFNNFGYLRYKIQNKNYRVHRLVASVLVPNPDNKPHVNHIDGNKRNNHPSNLEWVTCKENSEHAKANGLTPKQRVKRTTKEIENALYAILNGANTVDIAATINISPAYLCGLFRRRLTPEQFALYSKEIASRGKRVPKTLKESY